MYRILTPGEKLRNIRKEFKISQAECGGKELTRSMISVIELGKSNLMKNSAEYIAKNINEILKKKNIDEHITADYLIETQSEQIQKNIDKFILDIKQIALKSNYQVELFKAIDEMENFIITYKINYDNLCKIYEEISNVYSHLMEYTRAKLYMNKCIAFAYIDNENLLSYYSEIVRINYRLGEYREVICLFETVRTIINRNKVNDNEETKSLFLNASLSYGYLGMYKESLECLEQLGDSNAYTEEKKIDIRIQRANCLMELKNLQLAETEFNYILEYGLNNQIPHVSGNAYLNLAIIEMYKGNYSKTSELCALAAEIKIDNATIVSKHLFYILDTLIKINDLDLICKYYKNAFNSFSETNNKSYIKELSSNISQYFINNNYSESLDDFIKYLYKNNKKLYFNELSNIFILAFNHVKDKKNKFNEYIDMAANLAKNIMGI